jgi:hypothetical protein
MLEFHRYTSLERATYRIQLQLVAWVQPLPELFIGQRWLRPDMAENVSWGISWLFFDLRLVKREIRCNCSVCAAARLNRGRA